MIIAIPAEVRQVLSRLNQGGYEAFLVGGCVRDSLLGAVPKDWDVATSALPRQTLAAMDGLRVIETGLRHGTVTVIPDTLPVEVTTYRVDGAYTDHRRPDCVTFTRNLEEDLKRRDFTINALAYSESASIIDYFGGQDDLHSRLIRCVGDPDRRFSEDALRILRALRFSSELGFSIHPDTAAAMARGRELLSFVAVERVCAELKRLVCGQNAGAVLTQYGAVLAAVLPEVDDWQRQAAFVQKAPAHEVSLRLAALLSGSSPDEAEKVLRRLRFDRRTISTVTRLLQFQKESPLSTRLEMKQMLYRFGAEFLSKLLRFQRVLAPESHVPQLTNAENLLQDVLASGECWSLSMLAVDGSDLLRAGAPHGKTLGRCLNELLRLVMDGTLPNEKQALLSHAAVFWS